MKISVVIVEYHSLEEVRRCVKSYRESVPGIEVVVSSNSGYPEERQREIEEEFAGVLWHFNARNGGFAYGMNEGLSCATGEYLIISNPDCVVYHGIEEMAEYLAGHPEAGAIGPRIVDGSGKLQDSCRRVVTLPRFVARQARRLVSHEEVVLDKGIDYSKVQPVDWLIGAFIMVPRSVYETTGGLSMDYFMYTEDMDWCTRIRKLGYEVIYYPPAEIEYKGSRRARRSWKYTWIFVKSMVTYWRKFGFFG